MYEVDVQTARKGCLWKDLLEIFFIAGEDAPLGVCAPAVIGEETAWNFVPAG